MFTLRSSKSQSGENVKRGQIYASDTPCWGDPEGAFQGDGIGAKKVCTEITAVVYLGHDESEPGFWEEKKWEEKKPSKPDVPEAKTSSPAC